MKVLNIGEHKLSIKTTLLLMLITFVFSVACRMIWIYQFHDVESFKWNNELMINTNDGYYFAEGAKDILIGDYSDQRSPTHTFISKLTAFLTQILPFSLEKVILFMPIFLSSLIVIPIVLIGRALGNTYLGAIAALLASITWSYYNRTMAGYYDTDMLNIVFPMMILLGFILTIYYKHVRYILISAISIVLYEYWYSASYSLSLALIVVFTLYLTIKDRHNKQNYLYISLLLISIANIDMLLKIFLLSIAYLCIYFLKNYIIKYIYYILSGLFFIVLFTGGFNPIIENLNIYLFRETTINSSVTNDLKLHYYSVTQTVREAGKIPFETFANRISGNTISFVLSCIGYLLLVIRYPIMLLGIPMIGLGFIALNAGLRFTVYAIPMMAFGFSFLILFISKALENFIHNSQTLKVFKIGFIAIAISLFLYPNIKHIYEYRVPTVFNAQEVAVLEKLKNISQKDDYVIAWWDYGYPIRFYANINTLIDGGLHSGNLNFPVSFSLSKDQTSGANMARLNVEYTKQEKNFQDILKDYNITNINDFLDELSFKDFKLPSKTSDIYLYLPNRMLNIFSTVKVFSNIDLVTGTKFQQPLFYKTDRFKDDDKVLNLGNGVMLDKQSGKLRLGNQVTQLKQFIVVGYDQNNKLQKKVQTINPNSNLFLIFMQSYNTFLLLDEQMYNSLFIQLFVLENYDKDLFEPVILSPYAKVYRLKI